MIDLQELAKSYGGVRGEVVDYILPGSGSGSALVSGIDVTEG